MNRDRSVSVAWVNRKGVGLCSRIRSDVRLERYKELREAFDFQNLSDSGAPLAIFCSGKTPQCEEIKAGVAR